MSFTLIALLFYLGVASFLYINQRSFIYFPDVSRPDPVLSDAANMEVITVRTEDGLELQGWFKAADDPEKPVIIMFHGNAGNIGGRGFIAQKFIAQGYGFLLAEYRGYGGNAGKPSEEAFYKDARAYIDWFIKTFGARQKDIIVYGESLGTGVAVQMGLEYLDVHAIVLDAPYTSLVDIARQQYFFIPLKLLMKDQFNSIDKVADVDAPILIIHGVLDIVVPYNFGKEMFDTATKPKYMETFSLGRHNDLYMYGAEEKILAFIGGLGAE